MNRLFRWGIVIALLVLLTSGFIAVRMIFVDKNDALVPSVVGLSAVEATNRLQTAGLVARIDQVDSDQPEGAIVSQAPSAGEKTERGKIVILRASRGGRQIRIPDVRGLAFASAVRELDTVGLKIGGVIRVSDSLKPAGTVIAQNPASPAMVLNNRMVDLLVSEGQTGRSELVQVPDLRGQSEALARQILQQSDLTVSRVIAVDSNQVPAGSVVGTQPRAGSRVPFGGAVALHIARIPEAPVAPVDGIATPIDTTPQTPIETPQIPSVPQETAERPLAPEAPTWNPGTTPTTIPGTGTTAPGRVPAATAPTQPAQPPALTGKTAKVRYQVPPLSRPLSLRIVLQDQSGARMLQDQQARGGEYFTMDVPYSGNATVTVHLDGELVWQEKYN